MSACNCTGPLGRCPCALRAAEAAQARLTNLSYYRDLLSQSGELGGTQHAPTTVRSYSMASGARPKSGSMFRRWLAQILLNLALRVHTDEVVDTFDAASRPMSLDEIREWAKR